MAVSDVLLLSFFTFNSNPAGREKTLCPSAVTVATGLESGRDSEDYGSSNATLLPWREMEEFGDFQDLNFILSNSLSHQESVAAMVSSSASSLSSPMSSSSARVPSTCIFSYPIRTSMAPGSSSGSLLYGASLAASSHSLNWTQCTFRHSSCSQQVGRLMSKFVLKASLSAPGSDKSSPDGSHLVVVVVPYGSGPLCMHPNNGHQSHVHDFPLGWQLPSRTTPILGARELLSSRDCHPVLWLPPPRPWLPSPPWPQVPLLHYQELKPPSSYMPEESKPKKGRKLWPQKTMATHICDCRGYSKTYMKSEKLYHCNWDDCGWKFAHSDELTRHYCKHTGHDPFQCQNGMEHSQVLTTSPYTCKGVFKSPNSGCDPHCQKRIQYL
ncbi:hypothetical protein FD755_025278 [Muntiacus reevesi]|uniref:C2H2-type domain-containing protein n=1 Tax=Muntiacus reevesi TaxID=9886 RepID=A0A5N3UNP7_MUNRE|nr:hypothetical protein FD755_025278 [Muntiacus reevesi]